MNYLEQLIIDSLQDGPKKTYDICNYIEQRLPWPWLFYSIWHIHKKIRFLNTIGLIQQIDITPGEKERVYYPNLWYRLVPKQWVTFGDGQ